MITKKCMNQNVYVFCRNKKLFYGMQKCCFRVMECVSIFVVCVYTSLHDISDIDSWTKSHAIHGSIETIGIRVATTVH